MSEAGLRNPELFSNSEKQTFMVCGEIYGCQLRRSLEKLRT